MKPIFRKPDRLPEREHVLVVGAPRSGTTLLATMLSCHSEVAISSEDVTAKSLRQILGKRVTGIKLCVPNQITLKRKSPLALRFLKKLGFIAESPRFQYGIEDLLLLPNLRIVAIIRNGNDTISSMTRRGRIGTFRATQRWIKAIETIHELKSRCPERLMVTSFEDLILNPESTVSQICGFLRLAFETSMLDGHRYNPKYPDTRLNQEAVNRHLREGIDLRLSQKFPATYKKYEDLKRALRQPGAQAETIAGPNQGQERRSEKASTSRSFT